MCHLIIAKDIVDRPDSWMVICAKNGDQKAFVTLLEQCLPVASKTVRRITRNPADAEDVLQDAILRAYLNIVTFNGRSSFASWFTRIAINSALMLIRRRRARPETSIDAANGEYSQVRIEPRDQAANPEVAYLDVERIARFKRGMRRLAVRDRLLVEMQYRGKSLREIAALSGLSVAAVKARLFRRKKLLRKHV